MHWVSAAHAVDARVALYDRLCTAAVPGEATGDPADDLNPASRELLTGCKVEGRWQEAPPGAVVAEFERLGYFAHDPRDPSRSTARVGLRDEWSGHPEAAPVDGDVTPPARRAPKRSAVPTRTMRGTQRAAATGVRPSRSRLIPMDSSPAPLVPEQPRRRYVRGEARQQLVALAHQVEVRELAPTVARPRSRFGPSSAATAPQRATAPSRGDTGLCLLARGVHLDEHIEDAALSRRRSGELPARSRRSTDLHAGHVPHDLAGPCLRLQRPDGSDSRNRRATGARTRGTTSAISCARLCPRRRAPQARHLGDPLREDPGS